MPTPLFWQPFLLLGNPSPTYLETLSYLLGNPSFVVARINVHSCPRLAVNWTPLTLPIPPSPSQRFPLFNACPLKTTLPYLLHIAWYSRVQWFFKLTMLHVVLDQQKISKTILEQAFSFFCGVLSFWGFLLQNLKNGPSDRWNFFLGHIGYQKMRIYADFIRANLS
jgi:hypothetical protein